MADLCIKRNDRRPSFRAVLELEGGTGLNLSGASNVHFVRTDRTTGAVKVDGAVTVENATTGVVRYDWLPGDTDTSGYYDAEFRINFPDGTTQTVPACGKLTIDIE